jgi:hypothetical protein
VNAATITRIAGQPIQGQGHAIGVDRVKQVVIGLRGGHSQGWAGFGLAFPGRARVGASFGGYCDAVRSIGSGQTAGLTVVAKPGAAPRQVQVRFL